MAREMFQRDAPGVPRRRGDIGPPLFSRTGFRKSRQTGTHPSFLVGHHDRPSEEGWWREGIATGTSFRRLVAKTLARQFGAAAEATCAPFQFALSTTDQNTEATVLSSWGVRSRSMMSKLRDTPVCKVCCQCTAGLRVTSGGTRPEHVTTSTSAREGSKEIPSCHCSSAWQSTMRPSE